MKNSIIIIIGIIFLGTIVYSIWSTISIDYKDIDESSLEQMSHPFFVVDKEQETNKEELAQYLYSQKLELAMQGKIITSSIYQNGKWQYRCDKIKSYKINKIDLYYENDKKTDTFKFSITYDVLPVKKSQSDWEAGNGEKNENSWITSKYSLVEFKKVNNGYKLISDNTGL